MSDYDSPDRYYTGAGDIYSVFRSLQTERATINIQFNNTGELYNSLVVDAFIDKRIILIDEITPREGHEKALKKVPFSILASLNGIKIHCKNNVIQKVIDDDAGLVYRIPFPDELLYLQRRDSYRARVPNAMRIQARCSSKTRKGTIMARVVNMSASGFRMEIEGQPQPEIEDGEEFDTLLIDLLDDQLLECSASIAHSHYNEGKDKTVCGCRFTNLQRPAQITINRFVTLLQREAMSHSV